MKHMVKLTFTEEVLGTASANPEIYEEFIAGKCEDPEATGDEVDTLPPEELVEKGTTVFHRMPGDESAPALMDYQIKGFFKDACASLKRADAPYSAKLKAYKKTIDQVVFVNPQMIPIQLNGAGLGVCVRPLRAQTAQGERVSLARSETVPPGSVIEFEVIDLSGKLGDEIEEWLEYGALRGIGQWRNSGKGRFEYEMSAAPVVKKVDK